MKNSVDLLSDIAPSATPTEDEIAAWGELPRNEQLRRLRAALSHPDCSSESAATTKDILGRAKAAIRDRSG